MAPFKILSGKFKGELKLRSCISDDAAGRDVGRCRPPWPSAGRSAAGISRRLHCGHMHCESVTPDGGGALPDQGVLGLIWSP